MKPSIPKGIRDFTPVEMARRNYIFNTIRSVFALYGFEQIETPAQENLSTLMGKYGEEGDKLLFRIQNSGEKANTPPEKGLRYDLTVPFARFVVMHQQEISFPFRRYQIQPVWRADRPQKGRYREFYQCDADIIGTNSLVSELELIQIEETVYQRLGLNVCLHLNNRKILAGIAEIIGEPERLIDITTAIDKLDKIGLEKVNAELLERGLSTEAIDKLQPILALTGSNEEKLTALRTILAESEIGLQGVTETETILNYWKEAHSNDSSREDAKTQSYAMSVELDLTLARGLNYYTGAIIEVKALDAEMGSISGGGRYDNLTGIFGLPNVSGVGVSFGADRIYDVLLQLDLFPHELEQSTEILFAAFDEEGIRYALQWAKALRAKGKRVEIYPEPAKMKKQMNYANQKHIPFVAIIGSDEIANNCVMLKNMLTGEQKAVKLEELTFA